MRIDAIYTTSSSWFNEYAQVDMLIDRRDNGMRLCEMKFYNSEFAMDKSYCLNLKNKIAAFQQDAKTMKSTFAPLIDESCSYNAMKEYVTIRNIKGCTSCQIVKGITGYFACCSTKDSLSQ